MKDLYERTAKHLIDNLSISTRFINTLANDQSIHKIVSIIDGNFTPIEKLSLMLKIEGANFFAGNEKRELRKHIILKWKDEYIDFAFNKYCTSAGKTKSHKANKLSELKWFMGGGWSKLFMRFSEIDDSFAGETNTTHIPDYEDIEPYRKLPSLVAFQEDIKLKLLKKLHDYGDDAKSIISLPTGAGKTRIAVEAYIEFLRPRFSEQKYLLWIAQSEELCEQAVSTFHHIWEGKEFSESLRIYRFFGKHNLSIERMIGGVVVCSINKLYSAINNSPSDEIIELLKNCGACIIDEAHRAVTTMYNKFYELARNIRGDKIFPICGLTATPGRGDDTTKLPKTFKYQLETPNLPKTYDNNPLEYFRAHKFLARPNHKAISTNAEYIFTFERNNKISTDSFEFETELKGRCCKTLANNVSRNRLILNTLLGLKKQQVIVYACNVEHAKIITSALLVKERRAAAITADTPRYKRLRYIEQFRNGDLQFIVNHSVLTTGFDAPKTDCIVICRPIFSDVLYEQIVGRGLRGTKFGGTEYCDIIDFTDNLGRFGDQQSYHRFINFWNK